MDSLIRKFSEYYIEKLSGREGKIKTEELKSLGIPAIIVQQVEFTVLNFLEEKILSDLSEWANTDSEPARIAIYEFLNRIKPELTVNSKDAEDIVTDVIDLCFRVAVQPRKYIPVLLFEDNETITKQDAEEWYGKLPAHQHLCFALVRYMEKKQLESINREQAERVVNTIDERLTAGYNPLNWMDILKPLFTLAGGSIHSELLRVFFEEKGLPKVALKFEKFENSLTDTEFIEAMSSAELLDFEGYSKSQHSLFEDDSEPIESPRDKNKSDAEVEEESELAAAETDEPDFGQEDDADDDQEKKQNEIEDQDDSGNILELFGTISDDTSYIDVGRLTDEDDEELPDEDIEVSKPDHDELSWNFDEGDTDFTEDDDSTEDGGDEEEPETDDFKLDDDRPPEPEKIDENTLSDDDGDEIRKVPADEPWEFADDDETVEADFQPDKNNNTIYDDLNLAEEGQGDEEHDVEGEERITIESAEEVSDDEVIGNEDDAPEDVPMWKSFLERDDPDDEPSFFFDDSSDIEEEDSGRSQLDDDEIHEQQITNYGDEFSDAGELIDELFNWLMGDKDSFVFEIFDGSEAAYEQALSDLMVFDSWKNASKYLEKEIFTKRNIDVYDETAVDFTDRLHAFFMEHK